MSEITNPKISITAIAFAEAFVLLISLISSSVGKGNAIMDLWDRPCTSCIAFSGRPAPFYPIQDSRACNVDFL